MTYHNNSENVKYLITIKKKKEIVKVFFYRDIIEIKCDEGTFFQAPIGWNVRRN